MGPYRNSGTCIGLAFDHYDYQHPNLIRDGFHLYKKFKYGDCVFTCLNKVQGNDDWFEFLK